MVCAKWPTRARRSTKMGKGRRVVFLRVCCVGVANSSVRRSLVSCFCLFKWLNLLVAGHPCRRIPPLGSISLCAQVSCSGALLRPGQPDFPTNETWFARISSPPVPVAISSPAQFGYVLEARAACNAVRYLVPKEAIWYQRSGPLRVAVLILDDSRMDDSTLCVSLLMLSQRRRSLAHEQSH